MQSFPSTFPSPEIRSLKSTPYSTGRVANRLGAGVRSEERSGRRSQGLKIRSESARKYISVQVLEETERQLEGLKSKLLKCSLCMGPGQGRESMDKQQGRDHICHKQYKQRLCKIIITRVKVHFVDVF